jgi:putative ABC transport system permease protein
VGTRRAIGATRGDILVQFFAEGTLGALIGCGSGMAIDYFTLRLIDARLYQPLIFSMSEGIGEVFASVALYSTFTLISSLRAVRIEPLVALRAE